MSRSKRIFVAAAIAFFLILIYVSYDISTRTTFPGTKPPRNEKNNSSPDSIPYDSARKEPSSL